MTLKRIESPNLPNVNHGFYTRLGGASSGIFSGLNCGIGSSDQSEIVEINRARVAKDMGGNTSNLIALHQFHSAQVITVDDTFADRPHADGVVSNRKGDILTILTADCQPVLFHDPDADVIGACHAGWKGALAGVITSRYFGRPTSRKSLARKQLDTGAVRSVGSGYSREKRPKAHAHHLHDRPSLFRKFCRMD